MSIKLPCDKCIHNKICMARGGSNQDGVCKSFDEIRPPDCKLECSMKIKDLISMLLEFDMREIAIIYTNKENNIIISITDTRDD